jgi:hypothetical protein
MLSRLAQEEGRGEQIASTIGVVAAVNLSVAVQAAPALLDKRIGFS